MAGHGVRILTIESLIVKHYEGAPGGDDFILEHMPYKVDYSYQTTRLMSTHDKWVRQLQPGQSDRISYPLGHAMH